MSGQSSAGRGSSEVPIRRLVADFETIRILCIPYALLPTRVRTAFGAEFIRWSDMADETIHTLRTRPGAGSTTVETLLAAARSAVSHQQDSRADHLGPDQSVQRLLDRLDERDRALLAARVWAHPPEPVRPLAEHLGVHYRSIRRLQKTAHARFDALLNDPVHLDVVLAAAELGRRLGSYAPSDFAVQCVRDIGVESGEVRQCLLSLAGPYTHRGEWLENIATSGHRAAVAAVAAVDDVLTKCPTPTTDTLAHALAATGMAAEAVAPFLASQALERRGDRWVRWGHSMAGKIESVLQLRGAPATVDELHAELTEAPSRRAILQILSSTRCFVRTSLTTWAPRDWGLTEYRGVSAAIAACIDAAGGSIDVEELIERLTAQFRDMRALTIRQNLRTLMFVVDEGVARKRTPADPWPTVDPLSTARGAYRHGTNEIRWATPVTTGTLRGSGETLPAPIADALGVRPGQERKFSHARGTVTARWRLSSTNGPAISSLRGLAQHANTTRGDTLVIVFDLAESSISGVRVADGTAALDRLPALLGSTPAPGHALDAVAAALDCDPTDVATVLARRGETDLAAALSPATPESHRRP